MVSRGNTRAWYIHAWCSLFNIFCFRQQHLRPFFLTLTKLNAEYFLVIQDVYSDYVQNFAIHILTFILCCHPHVGGDADSIVDNQNSGHLFFLRPRSSWQGGILSQTRQAPQPHSGHLTGWPLCCIGQRIVWQLRNKVIYLLSIYSQIRIFIEYGNKDTANT